MGRKHRLWRQDPKNFWMFVAPWVLGFVVLTIFPMAFALWMSFTNYDGISPTTSYVGFSNYSRAFTDGEMRSALLITVALMVLVVPLTIAAGLVLALLVNQDLRAKGLYRAILYLPAVIPITAGALTFRMIFDTTTGPVNIILGMLGLSERQWLAGNDSFFVLLTFILWGVGGGMVISLAALQSVPPELHEAGMVDGAGPVRRFFTITLPMISPILLFQVVTGVISAIQMFVPAVLLSQQSGGDLNVASVPDGLRVYMLYVYEQYFSMGNFGYASALLWLLFIVIVAFTAIVFLGSRSMVFYAAGPVEEKS